MAILQYDVEIPKFGDGEMTVTAYFEKFKALLRHYEIKDKRTIENLQILSLQGEALELFLFLDEKRRTDFDYLEGIFRGHFEGKKHEFLETQEFFSLRKGKTESFSKFRLRVCRKASVIKASERMKIFAFKNGIPHEYVVHLAKAKTINFEDIVSECENYEKVQELEVYLRKQEETSVQEKTGSTDGSRMNAREHKQKTPLRKWVGTRRNRRKWPRKMTKASKPKIEDQTDLLSDQQGTQATDMGLSKHKTEGMLYTPLQEVKEAELLQEKQTENIEIFQTGVELRTASQGEGRDEDTVSEDSSSAQIAEAKTSTDDKERPGIETVLNENSEMPTATETPSKQANDITEMTSSLDGNNSDMHTKIEKNVVTMKSVDTQSPLAKEEVCSEIGKIDQRRLFRIFSAPNFVQLTLRLIFALTIQYDNTLPTTLNTILAVSFILVTGISYLGRFKTQLHICRQNLNFMSTIKWFLTEKIKFKLKCYL